MLEKGESGAGGEGARAGYSPERSKRYSAVKTRVFLADLALTVLALAAFQLFLSRPASSLAFSVHSNFYAACGVFSCVFLAFMCAASFPLHLFSSFFVERRFGLSKQSFGGWLADEAKSTIIFLVLSVGCIEVFYLILRNFPLAWWAVCAGAWIFFTIVLTRLLPVLVIPLFFKYLPIEDRLLRETLGALADKAGVRLVDVCRIDLSRRTAKANAALVGLGKTRKVILADTLTEEFTTPEVTSVVAHEFAHLKYMHTWQLLAFSAVLTAAGFFLLSLVAKKLVVLTGASGLADFYLLPAYAFLMAVFGMAMLPLQNFFSRKLERQADRYALDLTGEPREFISAMKKLASVNLAETVPSRVKKIFLYDHPPIEERIRMAEGYRERGTE